VLLWNRAILIYVGGDNSIDFIAKATEEERVHYLVTHGSLVVSVFEPNQLPFELNLDTATPQENAVVMEHVGGNHFNSYCRQSTPNDRSLHPSDEAMFDIGASSGGKDENCANSESEVVKNQRRLLNCCHERADVPTNSTTGVAMGSATPTPMKERAPAAQSEASAVKVGVWEVEEVLKAAAAAQALVATARPLEVLEKLEAAKAQATACSSASIERNFQAKAAKSRHKSTGVEKAGIAAATDEVADDDEKGVSSKVPRSITEEQRNKIEEAVDIFLSKDNQQVAACACCDEDVIRNETTSIKLEDEASWVVRLQSKLSWEHSKHDLPEELKKQYRVDHPELTNVPLSPRGYDKATNAITLCEPCSNCLRRSTPEAPTNPPQFAICNGWAMGHLQGELAEASPPEIRMVTVSPISKLIRYVGRPEDARSAVLHSHMLGFWCFDAFRTPRGGLAGCTGTFLFSFLVPDCVTKPGSHHSILVLNRQQW